MTFSIKPEHMLLAPVALFLAIKVGLPMASARNEAAFPLLNQCPAALGSFIGGYPGPEGIVPIVECGVGILVIVSIPGAFGVFIAVLRGGSPGR